MTTETKTADISTSLRERAMLVKLSISMPRSRGRDKRTTQEIHDAKGAKKNAGSYNKLLFDKIALAHLNDAKTLASNVVDRWTSPWAANGIEILATKAYEPFLKEIGHAKKAFEEAKDDFIADLEEIIEAQKPRLAGLFDLEDYPSADELRKSVAIDVSFFPIPTSKDWRIDLSDEQMQRLEESTRRETEAVLLAAQRQAWKRLYIPLNRAVERLSGYVPGDKEAGERAKSAFHDTLVTNLQELIETLPALNLFEDPELNDIVAELKALVPETMTAAKLKEDEKLRASTARHAARLRERVAVHVDQETIERAAGEVSQAGKPTAQREAQPALLDTVDAVFGS